MAGSLVCLMDCRLPLLEPRLEIIKKFAGALSRSASCFQLPEPREQFQIPHLKLRSGPFDGVAFQAEYEGPLPFGRVFRCSDEASSSFRPNGLSYPDKAFAVRSQHLAPLRQGDNLGQ
jgi:hypothetical protein